MKHDFFYGAGCTALFAVGVLLSPILVKGDASNIWTALGAIANIATAFIALAALNSWKSQFQHEKMIASMEDLSKAASGLKIIKVHMQELYTYLSLYKISTEPEALSQSQQRHTESFKDWSAAYSQYATALENAKLYVSGKAAAHRLLQCEDIMEVYMSESMRLLGAAYKKPEDSGGVKIQFAEATMNLRMLLEEINAAVHDLRQQVVLFKPL